MKLKSVNNIEFKGQRVQRNAVSQLVKNNKYSLTEPNQRFITNSITELGKVKGKKNINFLLDIVKNLKYSTNIKFDGLPAKNNWKSLLLAAAAAAGAITASIGLDSINKKIAALSKPKKLTQEEQEILSLREQLLAVVDLEEVNKKTVGTIKNFEKNLSYFIASSETTLEDKKYVLEKLNYFMSDEYEINPQLDDKKSIAAAEIINDLAINTPGSKVPNIKAVNQKQHGICAAISIVRKKVAYEDKRNYIDSVLSELDNTDAIEVYDRSKLGSGEKITVEKPFVDFDAALKQGYRILDTSAMHWMQVSGMVGASTLTGKEYTAFDRENFDATKDSFFNIKFSDPELSKTQAYYQSLLKADNVLGELKAEMIKKNVLKNNAKNHFKSNLSDLSRILGILNKKTGSTKITGELINLEHKFSDKIKPEEKFAYIPNEEDIIKKEKIKNYLESKNIFNKDIDSIFALVEEYHATAKKNKVKKTSEIRKAQDLYEVAAVFRYQLSKGLEEENTLYNLMVAEGLKDRESLIYDTIDEILSRLNDEKIYNYYSGVFETSNLDEELATLKQTIGTLLEKINGLMSMIPIRTTTENYTSQIKYLRDLYDTLVLKVQDDEDVETILAFCKANGLDIDCSEDEFVAKLEEINNEITILENAFTQYEQILSYITEDGDAIISPNPKDIIIKKMEERGEIPSAKALRELQTHFEKISTDRSSDEFNSRQGKLKDKSLYNFTNTEKAALKMIKSRINAMYGYVHRQLIATRRDIQYELEELNRSIGINNGDKYWKSKEGSSGLNRKNQIKILEYITGKPYYETRDLKKAIEKIKTTPLSGITSSSVYHNDIGFHAQYVADIMPIEVKTKDSIVKQDVLLHDNTWGASEMENTWTDSSGIKRTDYSDNRGGTLGYITNSDYRNGNLVDRILSDMVLENFPNTVESKVYKKLTESYGHFKMPQYDTMILQGNSPDIINFTRNFYDVMILPTVSLVNKLKPMLSNMTEKEIEAKIKEINIISNRWRNTYDNLMSRITPEIGNDMTKEEYDKLADNDYLKVALEKAALKQNFYLFGLENDLAAVRDISGLRKFRAAQTNRALNTFKYAFSKDTNLRTYAANAWSGKEDEELDNIIKKYNLNLSDKDTDFLGSRIIFDADKFNGSLKNTISLIMYKFSKDVDKVVKNKEARIEIKHFMRKFLNKTLYFNKSDLSNPNIQHLVKFIDREFDPFDDEEFVKIFRQLQDMTNEEFKTQVLSKVKPEDLDIKNYTGYDILKRIQHAETKYINALKNTVYFDSVAPELNIAEHRPEYLYSKFTRKVRQTAKETLQEIYREISYDLSYLELPKIFDQYKGESIKDGFYPVYPKFDILNENYLKFISDQLINSLKDTTDTIQGMKDQFENYEIAHKLSESKTLDEARDLLIHFVEINKDDNYLEEIVAAAQKGIEALDNGIQDALPYINTVINDIYDFEKTTSKENLLKVIEQNKQGISSKKITFAKTFIQEKYRDDYIKTASSYVDALRKNKVEEAELLKEKLISDLEKYHQLQNPQELLNNYLKSFAKDSKYKLYNENYEALVKQGLNWAKLADIQFSIMDAINNGYDLKAKTLFKDFPISFGGREIPLDSDEAIEYLIRNMIYDGNTDTALMFIEKLGFGETYVNFMTKHMDFDNLKRAVKLPYDLIDRTNKFVDEITPIIEDLQNEANSIADFESSIEDLKKIVNKKAKKYALTKNYKEVFINNLDIVLQACKENPQANKALILLSYMNDAKNNFNSEVKSEIDVINVSLKEFSDTITMINQILLATDSEAFKAREEMIEKYSKIIEYKQELDNLHTQE